MGRNRIASGAAANPGGLSRPRGFTLLELVITVAVLAIALGVAIPSFQGMTNRNRLTSVANEVVAAVQLTRMEAVRRNSRVTFCPTTNGTTCNGANWMRSIVVAANGDVVREFTFTGRGLAILPSSNVGSANSRLSFGANGFARAGTSAATTSGGLRVCTTTLPAGENARDVMFAVSRVSVTTSGSAACAVAPGNG